MRVSPLPLLLRSLPLLFAAACAPALQVHQRSDPSALAGIDRMRVLIDYSQVKQGTSEQLQRLAGNWFIHTLEKELPGVTIVREYEKAEAEVLLSFLQMEEDPSYIEARVTWFVRGKPTDEIQLAIESRDQGSGTRWDGSRRIIIVGGGVTKHGRLLAASAELAHNAADYFEAAGKGAQ